MLNKNMSLSSTSLDVTFGGRSYPSTDVAPPQAARNDTFGSAPVPLFRASNTRAFERSPTPMAALGPSPGLFGSHVSFGTAPAPIGGFFGASSGFGTTPASVLHGIGLFRSSPGGLFDFRSVAAPNTRAFGASSASSTFGQLSNITHGPFGSSAGTTQYNDPLVSQLHKILTSGQNLNAKDEAMIEGIILKMSSKNVVSILEVSLHASTRLSTPFGFCFSPAHPTNHPETVALDMRDRAIRFILEHWKATKPFLESCKDIQVLHLVLDHLVPPGQTTTTPASSTAPLFVMGR